MELNYLREFVALAKNCQFQETAEALFLSQSSLSKHIKAIEKEFGMPLLKRSTRRVELTEFGRAFLPYATQIAALQKEYTEQLLQPTGEKKLILGVSPIITLARLGSFLAQFPQAYPEYCIEVKEGGDSELYTMLQKGECDLIIAGEDPSFTDPGFLSLPYSSESLVAVAGAQHPLAHNASVSLSELQQYPLAQQGDLHLGKVFHPDILPPTYVVNRESVLLNLLKNTSSVTILTYNAAKEYLSHAANGEFVILALEPCTSFNMVLYYSKAKQGCQVTHALIQHLTAAVSPQNGS